MPFTNHPSFDRPAISTRLWRYTDLAKFFELLTSRRLWLTNAEILAEEDPYEGSPGPLQFPHRLWKSIDEVPDTLKAQIVEIYGKDCSAEQAFMGWFMLCEQECHMNRSTRRNYYVNCWHAGQSESAAMWKIYGSPGAGVAIVSNGGRIESALAAEAKQLNLGAVQYEDPNTFQIGYRNGFDTLMIKRNSYAYEHEVRLVYWDTNDMHDSLANFAWNEKHMRFDDIIEDHRPINPGINLACDIDVLIERVVVSPFAPSWYMGMIERLRDHLNFKFPISNSVLLTGPTVVP